MDLYCKETQNTEFALPLLKYARTRLSEVRLHTRFFIQGEVNQIADTIQTIDDLRRKLIATPVGNGDYVSLLVEYLEYVEQLCYAFPTDSMIVGMSVHVDFQPDLHLQWTDILQSSQIDTGNLNIERGCILLNLAMHHYHVAEYLMNVAWIRSLTDQQLSQWKECIPQACQEIQTSASILSYLKANVIPHIQQFPLTQDLTSDGIEIVRLHVGRMNVLIRQIDVYIRSRFLSYQARQFQQTDIFKSLQYLRGECNLLQDGIERLNLIQLTNYANKLSVGVAQCSSCCKVTIMHSF